MFAKAELDVCSQGFGFMDETAEHTRKYLLRTQSKFQALLDYS